MPPSRASTMDPDGMRGSVLPSKGGISRVSSLGICPWPRFQALAVPSQALASGSFPGSAKRPSRPLRCPASACHPPAGSGKESRVFTFVLTGGRVALSGPGAFLLSDGGDVLPSRSAGLDVLLCVTGWLRRHGCFCFLDDWDLDVSRKRGEGSPEDARSICASSSGAVAGAGCRPGSRRPISDLPGSMESCFSRRFVPGLSARFAPSRVSRIAPSLASLSRDPAGSPAGSRERVARFSHRMNRLPRMVWLFVKFRFHGKSCLGTLSPPPAWPLRRCECLLVFSAAPGI